MFGCVGYGQRDAHVEACVAGRESLPGSFEVLLAFVGKGVEDEGERGLEGTVVGESCGGNNKQVEEETKYGETDDDAADSFVEEKEVIGKCATEEEESDLEHERRAFHDKVEMPCDHSVHLALSMSTAINSWFARLRLDITVEPLFAQYGDERGEEGKGQTGVEDGLDVDDSGIGATPLRKVYSRTGWGAPNGDDPKEVITHLCKIRLKAPLDIENESRCDHGEQSGLSPQKKISDDDRGGVAENPLTKINVVVKPSSYFFVK